MTLQSPSTSRGTPGCRCGTCPPCDSTCTSRSTAPAPGPLDLTLNLSDVSGLRGPCRGVRSLWDHRDLGGAERDRARGRTARRGVSGAVGLRHGGHPPRRRPCPAPSRTRRRENAWTSGSLSHQSQIFEHSMCFVHYVTNDKLN